MKAKLWCDAVSLPRLITGSIVLIDCGDALADSPKVVQIEEQWELSIGVPMRGVVRRRPRW